MASLPNTTPRRDVAKPGTSLTKIVVLPIALPAAIASSIVSSEQESCFTNSRSFIIGTGLKKCIPMTFSGRPEAAAISAIDREDVLVPNMQSSFVMIPSSEKILCFNSGISGTASITKSTSLTASSITVKVCKLAPHSIFCSEVVLPRAIPLSQKLSIVAMPFSRPSGNAS